MIDQVLSRPASQSNSATVVDYLELTALIEPSGRVRIDALIQDQALQAEEAEDIIGDADAKKDEFVESIEFEINVRAGRLGASYPFRMSEDAEELALQNHDGNHIAGSYLACLIASHIGDRNGLGLEIPSEHGLHAEIIGRMRSRIFQMIGTIALAGRAKGSAASVGWPRETHETIIQTMKRAAERGFPGQVRAEPNYTALDGAKDVGVDIVAWEHTDNPPSPLVWFGQIASGRNWRGKMVVDASRNFAEDFLDAVPTNKNHATIIPFLLNDDLSKTRALHHKHGYILDRIRLAGNFKDGLDLIARGIEMDESDNAHIASVWVSDFVRGLRVLYSTT